MSGGGTFDENSSRTITAQAGNGYKFTGWTENGAQVSSSASHTFILTGNRSLVAHFKAVTPTPDPPGPPIPAYQYRTLRHEATGVTLTGWFTPGTTLSVTQNTLHTEGTCTACDEIRAADERVVLYDVSISGGQRGSVELAIPVPSEYNGRQMSVWHCKSDHVEILTFTASGGGVTGTFSSLSPFAVFATESGGQTAPQTGDSSNLPVWVGLGALALAGLAGLLLRRRIIIRQKHVKWR